MDFLPALVVQPESNEDIVGIHLLNQAAFDRDNEANLVDNLRKADAVTLSLVAKTDQAVLGHILFSPMKIIDGDHITPAVGLGPLAVHPGFQRRGIGSKLVRTGLSMLVERGHSIIIVLGHPWFYPKFGFKPAHIYGIHLEHKVPKDVFMVQALKPGALEGVQGIAKYHAAFDDV